jgi:hypothetical protein
MIKTEPKKVLSLIFAAGRGLAAVSITRDPLAYVDQPVRKAAVPRFSAFGSSLVRSGNSFFLF